MKNVENRADILEESKGELPLHMIKSDKEYLEFSEVELPHLKKLKKQAE